MNSSLDSEVQDPGLAISLFVITPEVASLGLLTLGLYGMYRGIEIQHPLYAVLFFNLVVAAASSLVNISAFLFISMDKYIRLSNLTNAVAVYFHGTCWFTTSVIRYLYIMHNDWLFAKVPKVKHQRTLALTFEILFTIILMMPILIVGVLMGMTQLLDFRVFNEPFRERPFIRIF